jgi:hypothetical protein
MHDLYFHSGFKQSVLCSISTYSRIVESRVLLSFDDDSIEQEAETAADAFRDKHLNQLAEDDSGPDEGEIADDEDALANSIYCDLRIIGDHVTVLAIAGIYHLWERTMKELLESQFGDYSPPYMSVKAIRKASFKKLVKILANFGWRIRDADFYDELDTLRLVANIAKHGDGDSCDELVKKLDAKGTVSSMFRNAYRLKKVPLGARNLTLSREHFINASDAVTKFFTQFPEHMSMPT